MEALTNVDLILWEDSYGVLDGQNFLTWQRQLGLGPASSATAVPESTTALLLAVGLVNVVFCSRR